MTALPALRVLPIPCTEPPVVVLEESDWAEPARHDYVQGTLAVDFDTGGTDTYFGPQATPTSDLPDPAEWTRQMIRVALEVSDGLRPARQLSRWVTPDIHERLSRRGLLARRRRQRQRHPSRVRALLTCVPANGVVEVSAVVTHNTRVRALALRMVGVNGRWLITVFELG